MKFFTIALLALLAPVHSAFARYEVHNRTEKVNVPFTIALPYPASWKLAVGFEENLIIKPMRNQYYPEPFISWQQTIEALPSSEQKNPEYGIASCTFTAHASGKATITFSLPHKEIPDDVVITYQINVQE